jgi:hypothetical protein
MPIQLASPWSTRKNQEQFSGISVSSCKKINNQFIPQSIYGMHLELATKVVPEVAINLEPTVNYSRATEHKSKDVQHGQQESLKQ